MEQGDETANTRHDARDQHQIAKSRPEDREVGHVSNMNFFQSEFVDVDEMRKVLFVVFVVFMVIPRFTGTVGFEETVGFVCNGGCMAERCL